MPPGLYLGSWRAWSIGLGPSEGEQRESGLEFLFFILFCGGFMEKAKKDPRAPGGS